MATEKEAQSAVEESLRTLGTFRSSLALRGRYQARPVLLPLSNYMKTGYLGLNTLANQ
jgi:hypothetical protein